MVKNTESLCSSKCDQDAKTNLPCATTSLDEVTSSDNIKQDVGEESMQRRQDKDGDAPKAEEQEETEEEAISAPTETSDPAGKGADIQEVTEEEEQLVGNSSAGVEAGEEEASAAEGPGSRSVTVFLFVFYRKRFICSNAELQHKKSLCRTTFHLQLSTTSLVFLPRGVFQKQGCKTTTRSTM